MTIKTLQPYELAPYGLPDAIHQVATERLAETLLQRNPRTVEYVNAELAVFADAVTPLYQCTGKCKRWLHPNAFAFDRRLKTRGGRRSICRSCDNSAHKERTVRRWLNGFKR